MLIRVVVLHRGSVSALRALASLDHAT